MNIVIINGTGGAGKDTFIDFCKKYAVGKIKLYSTVDTVKEIAKAFGWDGKKDTKGRRFLSDLKDASTRYNSLLFDEVVEKVRLDVEEDERLTAFIVVREPEEIEKYKSYYGENCVTVLINRPGHETVGNHADENVKNYSYTIIIENDKDIQNFEMLARGFITKLEIGL